MEISVIVGYLYITLAASIVIAGYIWLYTRLCYSIKYNTWGDDVGDAYLTKIPFSVLVIWLICLGV